MIHKLLWVYILSLLPTFEGRYALLVGISLGLNPLSSFLSASMGVLTLSLILPVLLPHIDRIMMYLSNRKGYLSKVARVYLRYVGNVRKRSSKYIEKWGFLGLIIFVAIPLPATGIWTGSIAAYVFGLRKVKAIPALLLGGMISNVITITPILMS